MTGASAHGSPARRIAEVVSRALRLIANAAAGIWHAIGGVAEMLSDAGHGPRPWREDSDIPNPYAGSGPAPFDGDSRPQE